MNRTCLYTNMNHLGCCTKGPGDAAEQKAQSSYYKPMMIYDATLEIGDLRSLRDSIHMGMDHFFIQKPIVELFGEEHPYQLFWSPGYSMGNCLGNCCDP